MTSHLSLVSETENEFRHITVAFLLSFSLFTPGYCRHETPSIQADLPTSSSTKATNVPSKKKANVSMVHSVPELVVTDRHAEELGQLDVQRLRKVKKLVLLVDLDQTIIHTTTDAIPNKLKVDKLNSSVSALLYQSIQNIRSFIFCSHQNC